MRGRARGDPRDPRAWQTADQCSKPDHFSTTAGRRSTGHDPRPTQLKPAVRWSRGTDRPTWPDHHPERAAPIREVQYQSLDACAKRSKPRGGRARTIPTIVSSSRRFSMGGQVDRLLHAGAQSAEDRRPCFAGLRSQGPDPGALLRRAVRPRHLPAPALGTALWPTFACISISAVPVQGIDLTCPPAGVCGHWFANDVRYKPAQFLTPAPAPLSQSSGRIFRSLVAPQHVDEGFALDAG